MKHRIIVIYDGVHNPVFQSQVVQPLIKWLEHNPHARGTIISFERKKIIPKEQHALMQNHPRLTIHILHKLPFFGSVSLHYAARKLKKVLRVENHTTITARGPLAGCVVASASLAHQTPVIVQARGLAAQEYRYAHRSRLTSWLHRIRAYQYERIERWVYGTYSQNGNVSIETVSDALTHYLIDRFNAPVSKLTIASHDIPNVITNQQRLTWRHTTRTELGIPNNAYVYVYAGSAKPWQCPHETIEFFMKQYHKDMKNFLLILTQDVDTFKTLVAQYSIPRHAYHIQSVAYTQIYQYLAAANAGMLLRENHIINWVSRPTKALEYKAVGLRIIHNNTVAMLTTTQ